MSTVLRIFLFEIGLILGTTFATSNRSFPSNFKFGLASAAYQVEGGWNTDGKGENIWDRYCHTNPYYIDNNVNGDIACNSYHKYKEDVAMLKAIGADYYRFSLSWSRILPKGLAGTPINQPGINYYKNLIHELIENGIEPLVTMYHWDLPQPLQDIGGWPNPELVNHYAYYARTVFEQFGDLVKYWMTFNEPKAVCSGGYGVGFTAPGINASGVADYLCAHSVLKAHAKAYHIYDEEFRPQQKGSVGIVLDTTWYEPASNSDKNKEAAERILQFMYGLYANPIINGNYPQVMIDRIGEKSRQLNYTISRLPEFTPEEIEYIKGTHDFVAVNTYTTVYAQWMEESNKTEVSFNDDVNVNTFPDPDWEETSDGRHVVPWGLRRLVNWVSKTYGKPEIFVTENGMADKGGLQDDQRINYYRDYLSNLLDAIWIDGVNVTRYTAWSLMDNLEWGYGFSQKFGLYSVDFEDPERKRTPKASAAYYSKVIASKCLVDQCE